MELDYKNTYWNSKGNYQIESEVLQDLVPAKGEAEGDTEIFRCITNIYYDIYNNGGGNLGVRSDELKSVKSHLESQGISVPNWVAKQYKNAWDVECYCDVDDYDEVCDCYDSDSFHFTLTQEIINELEAIRDSIIMYSYDSHVKETL